MRGSSSDHRSIKIKCPNGHLIFMADGEGFEPPVGLPPQRFSRPPHSTALPTILNFVPPVFQPTVLVLRMIPSYLDSTSLTLVVKTRTPQHTLPTILNFVSLFMVNGAYCTLFFAKRKHKNRKTTKKHHNRQYHTHC